MNEFKRIYLKNGFFTACTFFTALVLPYSYNNSVTRWLLILLGILMYLYIGRLLLLVIRRINEKKSTIYELKFLFVTLSVLCAGIYFFVAVTDPEQNMITGLSELKVGAHYHFNTLVGFYSYLKDITFTYFNSLYYSIAVMSTLGDSNVVIKAGIIRVVVVFEVGTALLITLFKIGEFYSRQSTKELKEVEIRILTEMKKFYSYNTWNRKKEVDSADPEDNKNEDYSG